MGATDRVAHGALDYAELAALGLDPGALLDFSSNLNPFGPPVAVRAALAALDPAPYPDRSCHQLRLALAAHHRCAPETILAGNGANELIHLIARALLGPEDTALVVGPTYGEYAHASRLAGAPTVELHAAAADQFQPAVAALADIISRVRPRLTWLCAPNNPTGADPAPDLIQALAELCQAHGGLLVVDRAYHALRRYCQPEHDALDANAPPNLLHLYSLTKSYALAGLRLGYLLAAPQLVARVGAYQPAWSVSSAAQAAGLAALGAEGFLAATIPQLWVASDALVVGLRALGLEVWRGALPFVLVRTGDGATTRTALLRRGCLVRDCASFGLPAWVRVAPRRPAENARLLDAWRDTELSLPR